MTPEATQTPETTVATLPVPQAAQETIVQTTPAVTPAVAPPVVATPPVVAPAAPAVAPALAAAAAAAAEAVPAKPAKVAKAKKEAKVAKAKKEPKAKKEAKPAKEAGVAKPAPHTGQSGPEVEVPYDKLNANERKVLDCFDPKAEREPKSLNDLAAQSFPNQKKSLANSHVRNAMRRLVTASYTEKTGRGMYRLTVKGRNRLQKLES